MDQKEKEEDKKGVDGEEEDVIPSSQGEMFSSQSSTPDLLSPSCLIPILQPSQSISGTDTGSTHHPRVGDLLASTPSGSRPSGADGSLVEEVRLDLSATPSEIRLDLSDAPSEEQQSARRRRSDTVGAGADDSDVMFVEEVDPDVQVVFNSQPGEPATPAASATAAESQVGFRLSLSPSQSEEVSQLPLTRVSPAAGADSEVDVVTLTRHSSEEAPVGSAAGPSSAPTPDSEVDVVSQDAGGGGGASWSAGQPVDESGSQGFQPPVEPPPDSESVNVRLPHIQTPQVGSSGDSSSEIAGDTVFGHAQRLIDEQNRRRQLREQEPPPPPPPVPPVLAVESEEPPCPPAPAAESNGTSKPTAVKSNGRGAPGEGAGKASSAPVESCVGPALTVAEDERPASSPPALAEAAVEENTADGSQRGSQTTDMSLLSAWRSVMKSPGHTVDTSADPPQQDAVPPPPGPAPRTTAAPPQPSSGPRTAVAAAAEKAASAAAATATETPEQLAAAGAEAGAEDPESEVVQESPDLAEEPLPDVSSGYDPFRFHGTQSQETQPYRLRVKPKTSHTANKSTSTAAASPPAAEPADASFQRRMAEIQAEARRLSEEGFGLVELQLTWRREDKEVVRAFSLDEHDGAAFLRRVASSSMSSSGSSVLGSSTTTAGGHAADVSSSSSKSGASVIAARNKRQSTLSSVTLSTIEGRGARHSVSSSVEVGMAAGRRSIMSVQPCSPPSDGEVQYLSPPAPRLAPVPEFTSPDGRPPRPHGQPTAVSSLRSRLDESADQSAMGALPGAASQPVATSTQVDPRSGASLTTAAQGAAAAAAASSQDSGASHVTGSSPSPELPLQAPLPPRPLTDAEEEALSEREQSELPRRLLQPDTPCFALWGADKTYYPGRLVSEGRGGRWLVRFDDGTERQVLTDRILPVVNLWKGLSVFVKNQPDTYEAGIITGHRLAPGNEPLEYIVSLDSHPNVTSAVPRSWLSLTLDQAALVRERRQPSLGQLAVGSPSRDLSLDNLVTGRRRAAGAVAGRRLANFEASSSDAPPEPTRDAATSRPSRRAGSKPSLSRRKPGGKGKEARTAAPSANDTNGPEGGAEAGVATGIEAAEQDPAGASGVGTHAEPPAAEAAGDTTASSRAGGRKKKTPARGKRSTPQRLSRTRAAATPDLSDVTAAEVESPAAAGVSKKRGRGRPASTPSATPAPADTSSAAATAATPSGRGRKRIAASSTPTDEPAAAATATPSGRGRKRIAAASTPTDEPAVAATSATPSGRGRKRGGSSAQPEEPSGSAASAATPSGRGRKRGNTSAQAEEPAAKRTSTSAPRSPRKASPRSASPRKASGSEGTRSPRKASPRQASASGGGTSPRKASPRKASGSEGARSPRKASEGGRSPRKASAPIASPVSGAGGRGRKRAAASTASSPEAPTPPGAARGGGKSRKRLALAASALESPTDSSSSREHVGVVPAPIPGAAAAVNRSSEKAQKAVAPVRPLGEVPDVPTTLLSKHTFILTCGDSGPAAAAQRKRMKIDIKPPFDKEHVSAHITAHGGHVLSDTVLTAAAVQRMRGRGDLLLLANGPLRTAKYIAALAMGVPCVLYSWLQDSVRLKQCLPYEDYLLPAGHHPGTGEPLEQLVGAPPPLARLRVLLAAERDSEWGQMMGHVLAAAGATVKTDIKDPASVPAEEAFPADVVVAEADCPAPVLDWARQCSTPVVSGEWVIGSVVAHRRLGYTARPEFDHDATPRPPTDDA